MFERKRGRLGVLDPVRLLDQAHLRQLRAQLVEIAATRELSRKLAHDDDRGDIPDGGPSGERLCLLVDDQPLERVLFAERDEVEPGSRARLCGEHPGDLSVLGQSRRNPLQIVVQRHARKSTSALRTGGSVRCSKVATKRTYSFVGEPDPALAPFVEDLAKGLEEHGFERVDDPTYTDVVLNLIDPENPKPFRRKSQGTFVAAVFTSDREPVDGLRENYPMLVRALANIVLLYVPGKGAYFTTMERGHYVVPDDGDGASMSKRVLDRLLPLAQSKLIIENEFRTDLEQELWAGDELTEEMKEVGKRLDALGLLPAPFPIEELLSERELRHVKRLYSIGGLSYGNLSARKDETRFWMSASGVDKGNLEEPGRDMLLVSGYDADNGRMVLSVPPGIEPRRVSVDAIEHWMIYQENPDVKAILHVHAWMEGIPATEINFPCGTAELARSVAALIEAEPDPGCAVVGLLNHGITATGDSLTEILNRIEPVLLRQVPMV
jgi:Class II Aldolase and Adducin N-terminal domain